MELHSGIQYAGEWMSEFGTLPVSTLVGGRVEMIFEGREWGRGTGAGEVVAGRGVGAGVRRLST